MITSLSLNPTLPCTCPPPSHQYQLPTRSRFLPLTSRPERNPKWTDYHGLHNWDGLLDPLDDHLRTEILRYGRFVQAAYDSFESDVVSPSYATCRHTKTSLLNRTGLSRTGYRPTKFLRATSSINPPQWVQKASNSAATRSSWIGYVAVCEDKREIARLGRRDIVIAYRGTATCLEWLENLRATLTELPNTRSEQDSGRVGSGPMVESGFLSLYATGTDNSPSLKQMIREEVSRLLETYAGEPLSLTITGHSLGAALATLTAYDIKAAFEQQAPPLVTVVSFGGPRVGNRGFRRSLEKQGTKVLRIVNSDDVVTKVPVILVGERSDHSDSGGGEALLPQWIREYVEKAKSQWLYSEVGKELKLNTKDNSPYVNGIMNLGIHHDLRTYLHLLEAFNL